MRTLLALALAASAAGCAIDRASSIPVRKELATDCERHCATLDMRLTAVVVIANTGGCVCEPKTAPAARAGEAPRAAASTAAGGAIVAAAAAAQQQQQATTSSVPSIPSIPSIR